MLSVLKNTKTPVKFWFLKNYLSPTFKVKSVSVRAAAVCCRKHEQPGSNSPAPHLGPSGPLVLQDRGALMLTDLLIEGALQPKPAQQIDESILCKNRCGFSLRQLELNSVEFS